MRKIITEYESIKAFDLCRNVLSPFEVEINEQALKSQCRDSNLVFVRALIVYILINEGYSCSKAGAVINRDHATALHLLKYENGKAMPDLRERYAYIVKQLSKKNEQLQSRIQYHKDELLKLGVCL